MEPRKIHMTSTIYEEDARRPIVVHSTLPGPIRYVESGDFKGSRYRVPFAGKRRPRRKPGESPLDPPSE